MRRPFYSVKRAFTLIELLVVIAIIAILAAILFPVFAQAKESAKKTNCISNLKQISLAFVMYSTDFDDALPAATYTLSPPPGANSYTLYWWGTSLISTSPSLSRVMDNTNGYLQPYLKNYQIRNCQSAQDVKPNISTIDVNQKAFDIAYTWNRGMLLGSGSDNMSDIQMPAETILLTDGATFKTGGLFTYAWLDPMFPSGSTGTVAKLHARHNGEQAVIGWGDGHAKAMKVSYQPFATWDNTTSAATIKSYKLGDVLKYNRQNTTFPADFIGNPADWYYYLGRKPAAP